MLFSYIYIYKTGDKYSSMKMVCNGAEASINIWAGNEVCSGEATLTQTADDRFGNLNMSGIAMIKVQCGGSMCNYAKVREYDGWDQSTCQDGDYSEVAYVVDDCWEGLNSTLPDSISNLTTNYQLSVKFTCDASTVSIGALLNANCDSDALGTKPMITAADKCSTIEVCSGSAYFMVYSTILMFIASLFIQ